MNEFGNVENVNIHIDTHTLIPSRMYVISGVLLKSPGGRHVSRPDDVIYHIDVAYTHFSDSSPK